MCIKVSLKDVVFDFGGKVASLNWTCFAAALMEIENTIFKNLYLKYGCHEKIFLYSICSRIDKGVRAWGGGGCLTPYSPGAPNICERYKEVIKLEKI